ncbi:cadherin-like beta sandwich domain-containing protein [Caproicibacter fermentans]|uniref:Cadherin-like beta sandwich domain-containing protein n=1 Tax=Caproicibacter fermentans TaxID=2576756 RepID=A0A7G8TA12_9FIRM|nr:cadherin-like beta sandwich domain-containing protein [Caproicibacter fermentans]QNK40453.1 cadherin-like beta sandwich domain-containing protein [Caproicibacter fermentans]
MSRNTVSQKALSILLCFALVCGIFSLDTVGVYADQPTMDESHLHDSQIVLDLDSGSIMFTAYGYNAYTFGDGIYHCFDSNATIIIRQSSTNSTTNTIMDVGTPYPVNLTLDGVNIDVSNVTDPLSKTNDISNTAKHCALCLSDLTVGNDYPAVNLTLKDSNYLKSGSCFAGLQVDGKQTLKIDGSGSLTATGGLGGAGIGGGAHVDTVFQDYGFGCGTIGIRGGTVTAVGGDTGTVNQVTVYGGAGIGGGGIHVGNGGDGESGGNLTVSGGAVTANGNGGSAGIGGGAGFQGGSNGTVSITGGTVTANGSTALVNYDGLYTLLRSAGIGGAGGKDTGGSGGTITISGGTVTAKSSGAAMVKLPNAPENDNVGNYVLQYGGSISQGGQTYHIYYKYINGFGYLYHATWENGSMDHILQVPTDGAAIGSGGICQNNMLNSEHSSHSDSGDGGTIEISGGTVTAESTETTDSILGGADIGNSEASYYYKTGCSHYTLMGSCRFTGGSINTHLTGNFAASPAPTDGNGNPVYKTTATLPDIHTPTTVTVKLASGGFSAQTDEKGGLYLWLPETGSSDTVQYNVTINGADISYELKGTVKTDGSSQLTPYRTDASLENLSFGGQQASPTSTPGTYQVNVGSSTKIITIQELTTSDLYSFSVNGMVGSATRSVVVAVQELETDLSVLVSPKGDAEKHYTVRVMRAARNNTALTGLAINDRAWIPDADGAYRFIVENSMTAAKVRAVPLDPNASYTIQANGKTLTPGADGAEVALGDMGSTTDISIVVRAEDGTTQKTYHLFLFRSGSRLSDLISVLSPSGAAICGFNITASVGSGTASIPVDVTVSKGAVWGDLQRSGLYTGHRKQHHDAWGRGKYGVFENSVAGWRGSVNLYSDRNPRVKSEFFARFFSRNFRAVPALFADGRHDAYHR